MTPMTPEERANGILLGIEITRGVRLWDAVRRNLAEEIREAEAAAELRGARAVLEYVARQHWPCHNRPSLSKWLRALASDERLAAILGQDVEM